MKVNAYEILEELSIIRAMILSQEVALAEFVSSFESKIEESSEESFVQNYEGDPGEVVQYSIAHYKGISERDYDVKEIFEVVMPIYQRQAMLITIWSAFETNLAKLSNYAHSLKDKKVRSKGEKESLAGYYVNTIIDVYGHKEVSKNFKDYFKILNSDTRIIRNQWAHHGGRNTKKLPELATIGLYEKYSQIVITEEYLLLTLNRIDCVANELVKIMES